MKLNDFVLGERPERGKRREMKKYPERNGLRHNQYIKRESLSLALRVNFTEQFTEMKMMGIINTQIGIHHVFRNVLINLAPL